MKIARFFAQRYLTRTHRHSRISLLILICWFSISLSICIVTLICGIMEGFHHETVNSMQSIYPDLTMSAQQDLIDSKAIDSFLNKNYQNSCVWTQKTVKSGLYVPGGHSFLAPLIITLIAIVPEKEALVTTIGTKLIDTNLDQATSDGKLIIGQTTAQQYNLKEHDPITVHIIDNLTVHQHYNYHTYHTTVGGIFKTGIEQLDLHTFFCSYETINTVFSETVEASQIDLKIQNKTMVDTIQKQLIQATGLSINRWEEQFPALIEALKLEKKVGFCIAFLIMLMAIISIITLLFSFIQVKSKDIALLKSVGTSISSIRLIFVLIGTIITASAGFIGISVGIGIGTCIDRWKLITLPDAYYTSHLIFIVPTSTLLIFYIITVLTSIVLSWYITHIISADEIGTSLRFE
ncbi:ABC transporter permease [bacterium]|nr:MAG: ABC transporter permease [bacterium]QQR61745.1 MAG: ABC transporter permease [bacterium]